MDKEVSNTAVIIVLIIAVIVSVFGTILAYQGAEKNADFSATQTFVRTTDSSTGKVGLEVVGEEPDEAEEEPV